MPNLTHNLIEQQGPEYLTTTHLEDWMIFLLSKIQNFKGGFDAKNIHFQIYKKIVKWPIGATLRSWLCWPGSVFTTLYFLRNLQIGPISKSIPLH